MVRFFVRGLISQQQHLHGDFLRARPSARKSPPLSRLNMGGCWRPGCHGCRWCERRGEKLQEVKRCVAMVSASSYGQRHISHDILWILWVPLACWFDRQGMRNDMTPIPRQRPSLHWLCIQKTQNRYNTRHANPGSHQVPVARNA